MAKRRKLDPNRFKKSRSKKAQQLDGQKLFAFDPIRKEVMTWGFMSGAVGGGIMLITHPVAQVLGIVVVVLVSNYRVSRAADQIPRWHALVNSSIGVAVGLMAVISLGTIILAVYGTSGG